MFDDFERYARVPDVYAAPEPPKPAPMENLHEWLLDKGGRDQYVARAGDETAVCWNDGKRSRCEEVGWRPCTFHNCYRSRVLSRLLL